MSLVKLLQLSSFSLRMKKVQEANQALSHWENLENFL